MTHVRVMRYIEMNDGMEQVGMLPGVFPYAFVKDMLGEAFVQERFADGSIVPVYPDDTP